MIETASVQKINSNSNYSNNIMKNDISIIVVNWNTKTLLINCLNSIYKKIKRLAFEVWVVDNGSSDGSCESVKRKFPEVKLIQNKYNLGFAKANNRALTKMNGRYAVLLNSDALLTEGALEMIVRFMDSHTEVGICGGQLLNRNGTKQNSFANFPNLSTELFNKSLLRRLFPKKYPGKEHNFLSPIEVDSVIGACMIVKKEAIDDVGMLDEDYFFFFEETDWCLRMKKKGWKIVHLPDAKIYHLQGQTARRINIRARIEYWKSRYIFFEKNYDSRVIMAILKSGLMVSLLAKVFFNFFINLATLFSHKKSMEKLVLCIRLLEWHFKGRPEGYGLK